MSLREIAGVSLKRAGAICATLLLTACSVSPLHGTAGVTSPNLVLSYAEPNTRPEQIVYRHIGGMIGAGNGPLFSARVAISSSALGRSNVSGAVRTRQSVAQVTYTVSEGDTIIAEGTRRASAHYQTTGQIIADDTARIDAEEEAVRAAAEHIRLALMASFAAR